MNKYATLWLVGLLAAAAVHATETNAPAPAVPEPAAHVATPPETATEDNVGPVILEAMTLMRKQGLKFDAKLAQRAAIEAVLKTADPRGRVLTEKELAALQQEQQGVFFDAGLTVAYTTNGWRVANIASNTPAANTLLRPGDTLLALDGVALSSQKLVSVFAPLRSSSAAAARLKIRSAADGKEAELDIKRAALPTPAMDSAEAWPFQLAYLRLNGVHEGCAAAVSAQLAKWAGEQRFGLVLDLRGANGTSLADAATLAGLWAENGQPLFKITDRKNKELEAFKAKHLAAPLDLTVIALVDGETRGAAEALAAALAGTLREGMLVGQPTAGDPRVREFQPLPSGLQLYVATRKLVTGDGRSYDGREGVVPDIRVGAGEEVLDFEAERTKPDTLPEEKQDRFLRGRARGDATLQRALDILRGIKALKQRATDNAKAPAR
jgi:carboxyl-terminal processing protease